MEGEVAEAIVEHEAVPTDSAAEVFADPQAALQEADTGEDTGSLVAASASPEATIILERIKENDALVQEYQTKLYWPLAEDLYEVQQKEYFKELGHKSFSNYLDRELKMGRGHGYSLAKLYYYFSVTLKGVLADKPDLYGQFVNDVKSMGWAKALKISEAKVITGENAVEMIPQLTEKKDNGKHLSVNEISKLCKVEKDKLETDELEEADGGEETQAPSQKTLKLTMPLTQYNDIIRAIEQMKSVSKSGTKDSTLLRSICIDYLSTHSAGKGGEVDLQSVFSTYERLTELNIVAFKPQSGEVVYGEDNVANLSKESSE